MNSSIKRPSLGSDSSEIARIANLVASDPEMREEFGANPVLFLSKCGVNISDSKLFFESGGITTETCTSFASCNVDVNAILTIQVVVTDTAQTFVWTQVQSGVIASVEDPLRVEGFSPTDSFVV